MYPHQNRGNGRWIAIPYNGYYNIHYILNHRLIAIMMSLKSPKEMAFSIAKKARAKRLRLNLSQQTLSEKSGVSYGTLKKFEQTGQISLTSLLLIALVLDEFESFEVLFAPCADALPASIDELLQDHSRKRGRQ